MQQRINSGHARAAVLSPERRQEIARLGGQAKANKFRNQPTVVDNIRFASKKEANYYLELQFMKASGEIRGFTRQVSLPLASGKRRMVIDFLVVELDGRHRWIDAKGRTHPTWAVKRDELEHSLGIKIETV
ncbi:MAG: hypothetical protein JWO52_3337 [Gammaproteobacteria bacterium]|nr:hypothetical protein [Gammaproteobacteria bacterium]